MAVIILRPEDEPTYPEYQQLAGQAKARAGRNPFVDPANMFPEAGAIARRGRDWARAVLGFVYDERHVTRWHQELLLLADQHDVTPPLPEEVVAARAVAEQKRLEEERARTDWYAALETEWAALREAMPVPVAVVHNYQSARHCPNGYEQGADHILVQEPLQRGRLARLSGQGLCETNSRRKDLFFDGRLRGEEDLRLPTCKACIKSACKLTGLTAPTMLARPRAFGGGVPMRVWNAKTPQGRRWPR